MSWVQRFWSSESESPGDKNRSAVSHQCMASQAAWGREMQAQVRGGGGGGGAAGGVNF